MSIMLTLVAARDATTLTDGMIARVRDAVRAGPPEILSPGEAADLPCATPPDLDAARAALDGVPVDVIATRARGRRKGLLVADMDSTIVTSETLDELAAFAGLKDRIAEITKRAMNGELDFAEALQLRVGMLQGLRLDALEKTWQGVRLTPGAKELVATMRAHNALTALVSGGFTFFTSRVAALCGFHENRANTLLDDGTALTGQVGEPILGRDAKLRTLQELTETRGLRPAATLAIGDGANDLDMICAAGLGIAFHAKPIVAEAAQHRIDHADLRAVLFAQGYRAADFRQE
jgi:phosphoserine phosphatase